MDPQDLLRQTLNDAPEVRFALLYGSRAAGGRPRPDSDWDVAVYLDEGLSDRERFETRLRLATELSDLGRVDVVVLNDAPALLGHRALQGERLFVRDRVAYVRYFVRTISASLDEAHYRAIHRRERQRRLREGIRGRP